ncbi:MAG: hypothetical protein ICV67_00085 [Thermoleophilia bacterium]|nr:hypothetical protein [Thermoleophilia bacterium]
MPVRRLWHRPRDDSPAFRQAGTVVLGAAPREGGTSESLWATGVILLAACGLLLLAAVASPRVLRGAVLGLTDRRAELFAAAISLLLGLLIAHAVPG